MSSNTSSTTSSTATSITESELAAEVRRFAAGLRSLVATLEPREVPLCWAPDVLEAFVAAERVASAGRMLMTARAAEAGEWERQRCPSPEEWLARQLGTTAGRARTDLETSERLGELDATAGAVRDGRLSPEQAGVIADASSVNPAAEQDLLDHAGRESLRRTRAEAERRKAEARSEAEKAAREARVRRDRQVRFWYANGAGHLQATGPVDAMKDLEQRIQREVDRRFRSERTSAAREPRAAYGFDALVGGPGATGAGAAGTAGDGSGEESRPRRAPLTRMTLIRVDLAALRRGSAAPGELCEIGGIAVSVAELRRVLGDSVLQLVLTNGEAVVDVVSLQRRPTVAQAIAKLFTDACCAVEGCDRAVRLEFDHRDDWVRVKVTELANRDLVCDHHHDLKTYEGWRLAPGTGRRPMWSPERQRAEAARGSTTPIAVAASPASPAAPTQGPGVSSPSAGLADLTARLNRVRASEAARYRHRPEQDPLFDTG